MKYKQIRPYLAWLGIVVSIYIFMGILLVLADIKIFQALVFVLILASLLTIFLLLFISVKADKKREAVFLDFLTQPNEITENELLNAFSAQKEILKKMVDIIYTKDKEIASYQTMLADYEQYVEMWVHEIKLPLALLTLVLDNKQDELSPDLSFKLDYIRNQIQNNIAQILFYYRIRSEKSDFLFEYFDCLELLKMVLEDYRPLLDEKKFSLKIEAEPKIIYKDRRSFEFILSQLIGNSIKYSVKNPTLHISIKDEDAKTLIIFEDNGCGVKSCDLPHIFNMGFTGDSGEARKQSTGMGLYLVAQLAKMLKIEIRVKSEWQNGFTITLVL